MRDIAKRQELHLAHVVEVPLHAVLNRMCPGQSSHNGTLCESLVATCDGEWLLDWQLLPRPDF